MEKHLVIKQQFFDLSNDLNSTNLVENKIFQTYFYVKRVNEKTYQKPYIQSSLILKFSKPETFRIAR